MGFSKQKGHERVSVERCGERGRNLPGSAAHRTKWRDFTGRYFSMSKVRTSPKGIRVKWIVEKLEEICVEFSRLRRNP